MKDHKLGVFMIENHTEPIREMYANKADFLQRVSDNDDGDVLWATWDGVPIPALERYRVIRPGGMQPEIVYEHDDDPLTDLLNQLEAGLDVADTITDPDTLIRFGVRLHKLARPAKKLLARMPKNEAFFAAKERTVTLMTRLLTDLFDVPDTQLADMENS